MMAEKEQAQHDSSYKQLFSHPEMVRDLLMDYFGEDWVKDLDFTTLESKNVHYVTHELRKKSDDILTCFERCDMRYPFASKFFQTDILCKSTNKHFSK